MKIVEATEFLEESGLYVHRYKLFPLVLYQHSVPHFTNLFASLSLEKLWRIKDCNELSKFLLTGSSISLKECLSMANGYNFTVRRSQKGMVMKRTCRDHKGVLSLKSANFVPPFNLSSSSLFEEYLLTLLIEKL